MAVDGGSWRISLGRRRRGGVGRLLVKFRELPRSGPELANLAGRRGTAKCCVVVAVVGV